MTLSQHTEMMVRLQIRIAEHYRAKEESVDQDLALSKTSSRFAVDWLMPRVGLSRDIS